MLRFYGHLVYWATIGTTCDIFLLIIRQVGQHLKILINKCIYQNQMHNSDWLEQKIYKIEIKLHNQFVKSMINTGNYLCKVVIIAWPRLITHIFHTVSHQKIYYRELWKHRNIIKLFNQKLKTLIQGTF